MLLISLPWAVYLIRFDIKKRDQEATSYMLYNLYRYFSNLIFEGVKVEASTCGAKYSVTQTGCDALVSNRLLVESLAPCWVWKSPGELHHCDLWPQASDLVPEHHGCLTLPLPSSWGWKDEGVTLTCLLWHFYIYILIAFKLPVLKHQNDYRDQHFVNSHFFQTVILL